MVGFELTLIPLLDRMCLLIDLSQTHSLLVSWRAIISAWFEEVATSVCFWDRHDIAIPPTVKTYPVCDRTLWGSDKYHASA